MNHAAASRQRPIYCELFFRMAQIQCMREILEQWCARVLGTGEICGLA